MHFAPWSMFTNFSDFKTSINCYILLLFRLRNINRLCYARITIVLCRCVVKRERYSGAIATILYFIALYLHSRRVTCDFSHPSRSFYCVSAFGQIAEKASREQRRNSAPLTLIKYVRQYLLCCWINFVWTTKRKIYT